MFRVLYCLKDQHDWKLVFLAAVVCVFSAVVTTLVIERTRTCVSVQRMIWVLTAGAAGGFGIWATHFIAMMAFNPGVHTGYDLRLTILSLFCAMGIVATGVEVGTSRSFRFSSLIGGLVIGTGIASMHFLGMMALDMPGNIVWAPDLVAASIVAGLVFGASAMWCANQSAKSVLRHLSPLLLVLAIISHHFIAMGAVTVLPNPQRPVDGLMLSPDSMSITITFAAIAVLGLGAVAVMSGRRLDLMKDESNRRFRILLEGLEDTAIFLLDRQGRVTDWNTGSDRNNGYRNEDIVGRIYADVCAVDTDFPIRYREALELAAETGHAELEGPAISPDGRPFWGHTRLRALHDAENNLIGFANITHEITARKAAEDARAAATRNLDAALSHMPMGLCLFDRNERLILANPRFFSLYGLSPDVIRPGISFRTLLAAIMNLRADGMSDESLLEIKHARHRELYARPGGGAHISEYFPGRTMAITHSPVADGGWVSTFDDITERKAAEARIHHLSKHDVLTGLANRAHFHDRLESELEIAARNNEYLGIIALDIKQFKEINDRFGHAAGDEALKILARRLTNLAHVEGRMIARFGGDEFNTMRRFTRLEDLRAGVQILHECVRQPIRIGGEDVVLTVNMGVSIFPIDGNTAEALLNNADTACQRAKAQAGCPICFYEASLDDAVRNRRSLAMDLQTALRDDEFRLFYQVQQSVLTGEITGYEALIRWQHPSRGFVSPADFIPVAEETGAIVDIGAWVLRTACREAASWPKPWKIAVNLSPLQLGDAALIEEVRSVLIETGLSPSRLELEITESTIIDDKVHALHVLRQIKALGVTIAMDDFGTGYASLDTLNAFPFDKIKIDRSFLMQSDTSPQARAIVRAILALGRSLEIPVLAEGVETTGQLDFLREEGCDEAQGYLLGRPTECIEVTKAA